MNYLMLVCSEDAPVPPDADVENAPDIEDWCEQVAEHRVYGYALAAPATARTVRVRNGKTIVTDGPYVEAKEFICGFDLLECEDIDAAVKIAAAHPVAHHRMIELRPFPAGFEFNGARADLTASETEPGQRFMLMICGDGVRESDAVEAQVRADCEAWADELKAAGKMPFGSEVQPSETATTVRYRSGQTILSDGPFVEAKEFLAGLCVVRCDDIDEAVEIAARMPLAGWHRVEVRPFWNGEA
jgi:hypothetical protein